MLHHDPFIRKFDTHLSAVMAVIVCDHRTCNGNVVLTLVSYATGKSQSKPHQDQPVIITCYVDCCYSSNGFRQQQDGGDVLLCDGMRAAPPLHALRSVCRRSCCSSSIEPYEFGVAANTAAAAAAASTIKTLCLVFFFPTGGLEFGSH